MPATPPITLPTVVTGGVEIVPPITALPTIVTGGVEIVPLITASAMTAPAALPSADANDDEALSIAAPTVSLAIPMAAPVDGDAPIIAATVIPPKLRIAAKSATLFIMLILRNAGIASQLHFLSTSK